MVRPDGLAGDTRRRLLDRLRRTECSIPELSQALGISDTAVRNHVAALERDGLVERARVERGTGGKPARLYRLSVEAEECYPKAYAHVLVELLRVLEERDGGDAVEKLLRDIGQRLATPADGGARALAGKVSAAAAALRELGGEAEVEREETGWRIRGYGCPLSAVVREQSSICMLAASLIEAVTGRPVEGCCRHGDRPRCGFRVHEGAGHGGGGDDSARPVPAT